MPHTKDIKAVPIPHHLLQGAHNAINHSLRVGPSDKVTIICDEKSLNIAAALLAETEKTKASAQCFVLERLAPRPLKELPPAISQSLKQATVSIYAVTPQTGEHGQRRPLLEIVEAEAQLRHAHMLGITESAMCQGMLSDFESIAKLNPIMIDKLKAANKIRVTSTAGTDVTVVLEPSENWESSAGIIQPDRWDNLPNGEILTCPKSADGVFVCDNIVPAYVEVDRFDLSRNPLSLHLEQGRVVKVDGGTNEIVQQVHKNMSMGPNMDRIGLFGIGTNYDIMMPIGDVTQDQFVPGAYFAIGNTWSQQSSWSTNTQFPMMGRKTSLWLDDVAVIDKGRYDPEILNLVK